MKTKRENPLKVLFSFSGEARGKMTGSVILAFIGEMFGMAPYFVVTLLAKELYEGTATVERAAVMAVTAAVCMCCLLYTSGKEWYGHENQRMVSDDDPGPAV